MQNMEPRDNDGLTEQEFIERYDKDRYDKPAVTVDMLIFTINKERDYALELLLIERGGHPFIGKWAIPGGFVKMDESLEAAATRELKEETGLSDIYMEQLYSFGDVGRDPRMRVISVAYMALVPKEKLKPVAGDDAVNVRWFAVHRDEKSGKLELEADETPNADGAANKGAASGTAAITAAYDVAGEEVLKCKKKLTGADLAFDHEKVINTALERLKNKVEYTDIAFELAGEKFTLTQLQMVFEAVLGKKLHKPNFRRGIAGRVEKTDELETKSSNRPSILYTKKK